MNTLLLKRIAKEKKTMKRLLQSVLEYSFSPPKSVAFFLVLKLVL